MSDDRLTELALRAERVLGEALPSSLRPPERLHEAMRYAVLGGGKRMRPLLVSATGCALGVPLERLDPAASAVEIIHAYSLVHDDLPAMDDDALRRGQPTCHIAFGEAMAILAGDALQALAFELLASAPALEAVDPRCRVDMLRILGTACGPAGMAGGQAFDLDAVGGRPTLADLERMHRFKTGALILASVQLGALAAEIDRGVVWDALTQYGLELGLAFQIQDDILDVLADTQTLGKQQGADQARGKPTYPAIVGMAESQRLAQLHMQGAIDALEALGEAGGILAALARYTVERAY
jgi:geranylgeranyl pyrophosphate synthase